MYYVAQIVGWILSIAWIAAWVCIYQFWHWDGYGCFWAAFIGAGGFTASVYKGGSS